MPDITDIRSKLQDRRREVDQLQLELFQAGQRAKQLREAQQQLDRRFNADNPQHQDERQRLEARLRETVARRDRLGERLDIAGADLSDIWERFVPLSDPREGITAFQADYPILLFPLRLETRFKTVTIEGREVSQLWVRIYPDDALVDAFETTPSESEIDNLQRYWTGAWHAGGDADLHRAVWRNLAASHGPGRAAYLVDIYAPTAESDLQPERGSREEIILVIGTEQPLTDAAERAALDKYWTAVWRAGADSAALAGAFNDLAAAVGEPRARELHEQYQPFNIDEAPAAGVDRNDATVSVVIIGFPPTEETPTKTSSWTQAARVDVLPERFMLIGDSGEEHIEVLGNAIPSPLIVSPDPLEEEAKQFQLDEDGNLLVPDYLKWMTDFDEAVRVGMGFRINLTAGQAQRGFDRLYVLGIRLSADEEQGKAQLEQLLLHHQQGGTGMALLPQGTPTNNTESERAGYTSGDDADLIFDILHQIETEGYQFDPAETDNRLKRDGLWLAEHLGIDPAVLQKAPNAGGADQCEARAMNTALFPATLGYWLDTQMQPVFDEDTIVRIRNYFNRYVSGRGAIPAIRIGDQPYGILPATNFSNLSWLEGREDPNSVRAEPEERRFLQRLYALLRELDDRFWSQFAARAPHVGQPTANPQQLLLDLVGHHAASVEFYQQWAESLDHLWNRLQFLTFTPWLPQWQQLMTLLAGGPALLQSLGYKGEAPEILEKIFVDDPNLLTGPVVDQDPPLSGAEPLHVVTDDGKNYIEWLVDKASNNMDDLRAQRGFTDGERPTALLYLKLRHALELGYYDLGLQLYRRADLLSDDAYRGIRREPAFIHVAAQAERSESRYEMLYRSDSRITGSDALTVAEFIPSILGELTFNHYLPEQIKALEHLTRTPTARLERLFAEHIDCCSYRWDAWMLGLAHYRLQELRRPAVTGGEEHNGRGLYLGAFGWIEDLRPDNRVLSPVELPDDLDAVFNQGEQPPLTRDTQNGGYVHAPSLNHAVTAAVLRNGYLNNATPAEPGLLSVNLSSERVRRAMQFIEGMRNGQSLGALLGYQFERALHDRYAEAEVDAFIFDIRKTFPLRARRRRDTLPPDDEPIEKIEARNVVDGRRLLEHVQQSSEKSYPWGKDLQRGTPQQEAIINQEVDRLLDTQDAIADLAVSESVHQAVQGNYDRAAATMDAYSRNAFPPQPDVAITPRSGVTLTHRVGLQLPAGAAPGSTPRSVAEPAVNAWLADVLPPLSDIVVRVAYSNPIAGADLMDTVSWQDLQLEPIDLLYRLHADNEQAMTEVEDRVYRFLLDKHALRPDADVELRFTEAIPGQVTFFEVQALTDSLRALVLRSRPLKPGDAALPNEARTEAESDIVVPEGRITDTRTTIAVLQADAAALAATLLPAAELDPSTATGAEVDGVIAQVDSWFDDFADLQAEAGRCGVALSGLGSALLWRKQFFIGLFERAAALADRWAGKQVEYDALIVESEDPGLPVEAQFERLQRAERVIATDYTLPLPAMPAAFRTLLAGKKSNFDSVLGQIEAVTTTTEKTIQGLLGQWEALIPLVAAHDLEPIDAVEERRQVLVFVQDLQRQSAGLAGEVQQRLDAADAQIAAAAAANGEAKAQALAEAAKKLLGEEFRIVWQFELRTDQGDEWQKAWNDRAQLTAWLEGEGVDFPVDEWLYGAARVREKLHDWENAVQLTEAFGLSAPALIPLQFPYVGGEPWLALDYPSDFDAQTTGDRLLYTACYGGGPFAQSATQCGLLLDEWTEVLPGREETTGLTFHYDRPNNEPPQTMLLAIPSTSGDTWNWDDLTAAVRETFVMARKRAAEPATLEATPLARFLPATIAAVTMRRLSISSNLAVNNNYATFIQTDDTDG